MLALEAAAIDFVRDAFGHSLARHLRLAARTEDPTKG
jgi:hypothetical protein